jgi:hypothetical protein
MPEREIDLLLDRSARVWKLVSYLVEITSRLFNAADLRKLLEESPLAERKAFIRSFVKDLKVTGDDVLLTYTLSILPARITEEKLPVLSIVQCSGRYCTICRTKTF